MHWVYIFVRFRETFQLQEANSNKASSKPFDGYSRLKSSFDLKYFEQLIQYHNVINVPQKITLHSSLYSSIKLVHSFSKSVLGTGDFSPTNISLTI